MTSPLLEKDLNTLNNQVLSSAQHLTKSSVQVQPHSWLSSSVLFTDLNTCCISRSCAQMFAMAQKHHNAQHLCLLWSSSLQVASMLCIQSPCSVLPSDDRITCPQVVLLLQAATVGRFNHSLLKVHGGTHESSQPATAWQESVIGTRYGLPLHCQPPCLWLATWQLATFSRLVVCLTFQCQKGGMSSGPLKNTLHCLVAVQGSQQEPMSAAARCKILPWQSCSGPCWSYWSPKSQHGC